jgi:hypothetical protein
VAFPEQVVGDADRAGAGRQEWSMRP